MSRVTQNFYILVAPEDKIAEAVMIAACKELGTEYIQPGVAINKAKSEEMFNGGASFYCTSFERYKNIARAYDSERKVVCLGIKVDKQRLIQELQKDPAIMAYVNEYDGIEKVAERRLLGVADMPIFCDAPVKFELGMQDTVDHVVYLVNYFEGAALVGDTYKKGKPRQPALRNLYKAWREL